MDEQQNDKPVDLGHEQEGRNEVVPATLGAIDDTWKMIHCRSRLSVSDDCRKSAGNLAMSGGGDSSR